MGADFPTAATPELSDNSLRQLEDENALDGKRIDAAVSILQINGVINARLKAAAENFLIDQLRSPADVMDLIPDNVKVTE